MKRASSILGRGAGAGPNPAATDQGIEAIDAKTGNIVWKFPMARVGLSSGLVGTAGGIVFAASAEGQLLALDEKTGKPLWHLRHQRAGQFLAHHLHAPAASSSSPSPPRPSFWSSACRISLQRLARRS